MDEIQELGLRMEDLVFTAGIRRFDRIRYRTADEEVWFIWEQEKLVVIVELRDTSLDALRAAVESAVAQAGDPVLN